MIARSSQLLFIQLTKGQLTKGQLKEDPARWLLRLTVERTATRAQSKG